MKLWVEAANRLRSQLPPDVQVSPSLRDMCASGHQAHLITQATLDKHEADGTTDSKEYHDAVGIFYARHVCRLDPMPADLVEAFSTIEQDPTVYMTMSAPFPPRLS